MDEPLKPHGYTSSWTIPEDSSRGPSLESPEPEGEADLDGESN
mgnify:CR=1 FL=1